MNAKTTVYQLWLYTSVGRELEKREARYLALVARISAEIGARVVKTYYCEENFRQSR